MYLFHSFDMDQHAFNLDIDTHALCFDMNKHKCLSWNDIYLALTCPLLMYHLVNVHD